MRKNWDEYFMSLANAAAERATCPKKHVGSVLVDKNNNVIATGYNGSPPGEPHCTDVGCYEVDGKCKRTIHAEDNAIRRTKRRQRAGGKIYITHFPCFDCALKIIGAGLVEVVYENEIKRSCAPMLEMFELEGIVIRQVEPPNTSNLWQAATTKIKNTTKLNLKNTTSLIGRDI